MNIDLKDKNAVVCGSTQGIGRATALELASLGANVTLLARNEARLKQVLENLDTSQGQEHQYLVANFDDPTSLNDTIRMYANKQKHTHILVNNTGGPPAGKAIDADVEEFFKAFNNHLICSHHLVQALVQGMKQAGYGRIINVISTSVKAPLPNLGVSNTIRGAVANWAKTLANELGEFGITVNNVLPGFTKTGRLNAIIEGAASQNHVGIEEQATKMAKTAPANRFAAPEEVAAAIAFLATPAAAYINGVNLPVDGGRTPSL